MGLKKFAKKYKCLCWLVIAFGGIFSCAYWSFFQIASFYIDSLNTWYNGYAYHFYVYSPDNEYDSRIFQKAYSCGCIGDSILFQEQNGYPQYIRIIGGNVEIDEYLKPLWENSFCTDGKRRATIGKNVYLEEKEDSVSISGMDCEIIGSHSLDGNVLLDNIIFYSLGTMECQNYEYMFTLINQNQNQSQIASASWTLAQ